VRTTLRRIAPLTAGIGIYYVDLVLSRRFLSELGVGAQSYFSWAMRLCDFPQGVFALALSTAALPSLSALAARGERAELAKTWAHAMGLALFVALPASALLVAVGEPIVSLLFQRGHFDARDVHETARALVWQGGAVWTVAAVRTIVPAFYALGDTRTPVVVSAIDLVAFIALALWLRGPLGHVGISVAVGGSSAVQMVLLLCGLKWRLGTIRAAELARSWARTLAASGLGAVAGWAAARLASPLGAPTATGAVAAIWGTLAFGVVFLTAAWGMRSPELDEIGAAVKRRLSAARTS
jgi:putative peptidoglycan lipid II flippase